MGKKNCRNQQRFQKETSSGTFVTNELIMQVGNYDLPFGGVGLSGQGRMHGEAGFREMSHMKGHLVKGVYNFKPFTMAFPPFDEAKKAEILKSLPMGTKTQSKCCKQLLTVLFLILAITFGIIYRSEIGDFFTWVFESKDTKENANL